MIPRYVLLLPIGVSLLVVGAEGCSEQSGTPGGGTGGVGGSAAGGSGAHCEPIGGAGGGSTGPRPLGDLTGPWQLFLDDVLIDEQSDVTRSYHAFDKHPANPIMVADQPWEDSYAYVYGRVMPNEAGDGYHLWYSALDFDDPDGASRVLYANSTDGLSWNKPSLGIRAYNGNTNNNLFIPRDRPNHIMSVMHTPWDADPDCAYKLINFDAPYQGLPGGYFAACSPDGVHLTDVAQNPVIDTAEVSVGDVGHFLWDPWGRRYLGYVKVAGDVAGERRRMVGLIASETFDSWPTTAPELVLAPDSIDDYWVTAQSLDLAENRTHFYGVSVFPYQTQLVGLLWIFRAMDPPNCGNDCEPYAGYIFGKIHVEVVSSRDGVNWTRQQGDLTGGRQPILELGPEGAWDSMMLFTANHPLLEDGEIKLYYGGCDEDHGSVGTNGSAAVGLATLRKDGFASLDAQGASRGLITTLPLEGAQGPLRLNFRTTTSGSVKVEVLDAQGEVLPGYSEADCDALQGDEIDRAVSWGAVTTLPTFPCELRLRFILQDASIYSFAAGDRLRAAP
jgi:hypothetical protein